MGRQSRSQKVQAAEKRRATAQHRRETIQDAITKGTRHGPFADIQGKTIKATRRSKFYPYRTTTEVTLTVLSASNRKVVLVKGRPDQAKIENKMVLPVRIPHHGSTRGSRFYLTWMEENTCCEILGDPMPPWYTDATKVAEFEYGPETQGEPND